MKSQKPFIKKNLIYLPSKNSHTRVDIVFVIEEKYNGARHLLEHIIPNLKIDKSGSTIFDLAEEFNGVFLAWTNVRTVNFSLKFPSKHKNALLPRFIKAIFSPDFSCLNERTIANCTRDINNEISRFYSDTSNILTSELERIRFNNGLNLTVGNSKFLANIKRKNILEYYPLIFNGKNHFFVVQSDLPITDFEKIIPLASFSSSQSFYEKLADFRFLAIEKKNIKKLFLGLSIAEHNHQKIQTKKSWLNEFLRYFIIYKQKEQVDVTYDRTLSRNFFIVNFPIGISANAQEKIEEKIMEINKILDGEIGSQEFEFLKKYFIKESEQDFKDQNLITEWYANLFIDNQPLTSHLEMIDFVKKITLNDFSEFVRDEIRKKYIQIGLAGNPKIFKEIDIKKVIETAQNRTK